MYKIKKGDIVGRKSYGQDILFVVQRIIKMDNKDNIAILKGMTLRIEADAPISDLVIIEKQRIDNNLRSLNARLEDRIKCIGKDVKSKRKFFSRRFSRER